MSNSKLIRSTILSQHHSGRRTEKITKIPIHIMAGNLSAENCGRWFQNPKAVSSSQYGIGTDGGCCLYVDESNRAWTTSSAWVDQRAVTIEVANDGGAPNWHVSDKAYQALLNLVEDICRRNGIKECTYTGDSNGTLIKHSWYANKSCPGPYLGGKFPEIAKEVTRRLKGATGGGAKPTTTKPKAPTQKYKTGLYRVTRSDLNIRSTPDTSKNPVGVINKGTYTIVEVKGDWGKLKSGAGWIHLGFASYAGQAASPQPKPQPTPKKSIAEIVAEVKAGKWGNGEDRKKRLTAAGYSYSEVQAKVNASYGQTPKKTNDQIAQEVIDDKWGVYPERKTRLEAAGYNYQTIQSIVNRKLGY